MLRYNSYNTLNSPVEGRWLSLLLEPVEAHMIARAEQAGAFDGRLDEVHGLKVTSTVVERLRAIVVEAVSDILGRPVEAYWTPTRGLAWSER